MLQKARIREVASGVAGALSGLAGGVGGGQVDFQFNPETVSFTKEAEFRNDPTQSSEDAPPRQFRGTKPLELSLEMLLDDTVAPGLGSIGMGASVPDRIGQLLKWTNPADGSDPPRPPDLVFEWGKLKIGSTSPFACHCVSVQVKYTLFSDSGAPIRANATVKLRGMATKKEGQNPTSGGLRARRSRRVQRGDDLVVIAHREYGRQSAWRQLAQVNGIDNPFRLPVGSELLLPDRSELEEMR